MLTCELLQLLSSLVLLLLLVIIIVANVGVSFLFRGSLSFSACRLFSTVGGYCYRHCYHYETLLLTLLLSSV